MSADVRRTLAVDLAKAETLRVVPFLQPAAALDLPVATKENARVAVSVFEHWLVVVHIIGLYILAVWEMLSRHTK